MDFVLQKGRRIAALEVKSGIVPKRHPGLELFLKRWPDAATWGVGEGELSVEDFLRNSLSGLF